MPQPSLFAIRRFHSTRLFLVLSLFLLPPTAALGATFTVTSADDADDGVCSVLHCSLREALNAANASAAAHTITFAITGGTAPYVIQPATSLPVVAGTVTIDGTTQPEYAGAGLVIQLDGALTSGSDGLTLAGSGSTIRGLAIGGFYNAAPGIRLLGGGYHAIERCFIGVDAAGTIPNGNAYGIMVQSPNNRIGGTTPEQRNVISSNTSYGIWIYGDVARDNMVAGNYIGTDPTGTYDRGNGGIGIVIQEGDDNVVGGSTGTTPGSACNGACNVISGNESYGVHISGSSLQTAIEGNFIGVTAGGNATLGNGTGIVLQTSAGGGQTTIGGTAAASRNVISGNGGNGIGLEPGDSGTNTIQGNFIGTDTTGELGIGNGGAGISAAYPAAASGNLIGGAAPGASNVISSNTGPGIFFASVQPSASTVQILGNRIGTTADGLVTLGNAGNGISLFGDVRATIGGSSSGESNLISGNNGHGIAILDEFSGSWEVIEGNLIGTDIAGSNPLPNGGAGISVAYATTPITLGGTAAGEGNTIAFNQGAGVQVSSASTRAVTTAGNAIFSNGGLAIDLLPTGVNANDEGDADTGANDGQNFPELTLSSTTRGTYVEGTLSSETGESYTIHFYSTPSCDASGYGEADAYLGTAQVTTDGTGVGTFGVDVAPTVTAGELTATATDAEGNTSEMSACLQVGEADLGVTMDASPNPAEVGETITHTIGVTNNGPTASSGITLTQQLDAAMLFASAVPSQGSCLETFGTVTCDLGTLAASASALVTVRATPAVVMATSSPATVSADTADGNSNNDTATAAITVEPSTGDVQRAPEIDQLLAQLLPMGAQLTWLVPDPAALPAGATGRVMIRSAADHYPQDIVDGVLVSDDATPPIVDAAGTTSSLYTAFWVPIGAAGVLPSRGRYAAVIQGQLPDTTPAFFADGPYVSAHGSADAAVLWWRASEPVTAEVRYGNSSGTYDQSMVAAGVAPVGSAKLTGLTAGAAYYGQVCVQDVAMNGEVCSEEVTWNMLAADDGQTPMVVESPAFIGIWEDGAMIQLKTDKPTAVEVAYGPPEALDMKIVDPAFATNHRVEITGLRPRTNYALRVTARSIAGLQTILLLIPFATLAEGAASRGLPEIEHLQCDTRASTEDTIVLKSKVDHPAIGALYYGSGLVQVVVLGELRREMSTRIGGFTAGQSQMLSLTVWDRWGGTVDKSVSCATRAAAPPSNLRILAGPTADVRSLDGSTLTVEWETNFEASGEVRYSLSGAARATEQQQRTNGRGTRHRAYLTNLQPNSAYTIAVESTDLLGRTVSSGEVQVSTTAGLGAATLKYLDGGTVTYVSDRYAVIEWRTDRPASSELLVQAAASGATAAGQRGTEQWLFTYGSPEPAMLHRAIVPIAFLPTQRASQYEFRITSRTAGGASALATSAGSFFAPGTEVDALAPQISELVARALSGTALQLRWTTSEPTSTLVSYGEGTSLGSRLAEPSLAKTHAVRIDDFPLGAQISYRIDATDPAGNVTSTSAASLQLPSDRDDDAPVITVAPTVSFDEDGALVTWETNEASDSVARVGESASAFDYFYEDADDVTLHSVRLGALPGGAPLYIQVTSTDFNDNVSAPATVGPVTAPVPVSALPLLLAPLALAAAAGLARRRSRPVYWSA